MILFHFQAVIFPYRTIRRPLNKQIMQIFINDSPIECKEQLSLAQLLSVQQIQPVNIAVAIDNTVIPKAQWDTTIIQENNRIIIIKAVQGG